MLTRRGLVGLAAALALRPALAQGGSPARVGVLVLGSSEQRDDVDRQLAQGLNELGDVEGHNLLLERRYANSQVSRLVGFAQEFVARDFDVIVTTCTPSTRAARSATQRIPIVEPHYPKPGNGRPPVGLERMLRMYFVQHWFNLADEACEEALLDRTALRRFVGIDLGCERVPDGTTLLKFRRRLEEHKLGEKLFAKVGQVLQSRGLKLGTGTIVDAMLIGAPSSTKNANQARDPEMHQTRKGRQWYFGMKLHIGVDSRTGLTHRAVVTAANVHDKHLLPQLLHGNEQRVYGDSAYASQKVLIESKAPQARDFTNQRVRRASSIDETRRARNRNKSKVRARVDHVFAVVKRLWGFNKVRYRGLAKNATRSFVALGLANLYLARRPLYAQIRP